MNKRQIIVKRVVDFFVENGEVMDVYSYKKTPHRPVNHHLVKRFVGSWSRLLGWGERYYPELMEDARNKVTYEFNKKERLAEAAAVLAKDIEAKKLAALQAADEADREPVPNG